MAKKKKQDRQIIKLMDKQPDEAGNNHPTSVYWTVKNKRNTTEKLRLQKYNPYKRKHTEHVETK